MENIVTAEQIDDLFEKYVNFGDISIIDVLESVFDEEELKDLIKSKLIKNKCSFDDAAEIIGADDYYTDCKFEPILEILEEYGLMTKDDCDREVCEDLHNCIWNGDKKELFSELINITEYNTDKEVSLEEIAKITEELLNLNI